MVRTQVDSPQYATGYGYTFIITDSIKIKQDVFGFFDGNDMYVKVDDGLRTKNNGTPGGWPYKILIREFFKLAKLGRYAYIITYKYNFYESRKQGVVVADSMYNKDVKHHAIRYLGKKKEFINATPDVIGFLLRQDKDLFEAYGNEKKRTPDIMRKYLDKMNNRYPDWDPSSE